MLNLPIQQHNTVNVMSSLDLAKLCVGAAKDAHSDFLKKARKVLGVGIGNFSDTYIHPQNGQTYKSLLLPEREACLMAMSYSYDLQAKVYDAWQDLRNIAVVAPVSQRQMMIQLLQDAEEQEQRLAIQEAKQENQDKSINKIGSALEDVTGDVLKTKVSIADTNQAVAKLTSSIQRVNQPAVGYITAGEAVRTIFPQVSKGALQTMLARYGSVGIQYTYFVASMSKTDTCLQFPLADVQAIKQEIADNAVAKTKQFWAHPLNAHFKYNK